MTGPRVTIITVAYNSAGVLGPMLTSCPAGTPVIIVDNASADIAETRALAQSHGATLIKNAQNKGFGQACNIGAAAADTPFLFFLNPDATLEPDALEALLATADANPQAVAVNPITLHGDGHAALKRKSDLIPKSEYLTREVPVADKVIPTLNGAAILIRAPAFQAVDGFDPGIFLFFEDDDLGQRLRDAGGELMLSVAARVHHSSGHGSSGPKLEGEVFKEWHKGHARLYIMRKHAVPWARLRALSHAVLRALSPTLLVSTRHRRKRLAFLRGTLAALRSA